MGRVPEAASMERVEVAFGVEGIAVREEQVRLLRSHNKVFVERAARTLKKIAERDGAALYAWRKKLLEEAFCAVDVRVQCNLTIVLGKLPLKGNDRAVAIDLMFERLRGESGLSRTMALQALMDMSEHDAGLRTRVMPVVREFLANGTPAMQARARRLLGILPRSRERSG